MDARKALLEAAQHFAIPIEGQLGMQAAHDVELGDRLRITFAGALPDLFERHGVRLGIASVLAECAEAATGDADIGRIDMAVHVEIGSVAVQALADQVGQVTDGKDVTGAIKRDAVLERQPLAGFDPLANGR